jgi:Cu+-exporting ATPase
MTNASGQVIDLDIAGMTCTACAGRVEKALNQVPGVSAAVDFATERATISIPANSLELRQQLEAAVNKAGYEVTRKSPVTQILRLRLVIGAILALPVAVLGMIPALHFDGQQYLALALSIPIVLWVAWPFHVATIKNLKLGTATMDTLITIGSLSAFGYSVWLILANEHHNFLEVAAVVPVAVLFGKWLELKTRRSATDAVRALLAGMPEQVWTIDTEGIRRLVALESIQPGQVVLVAAGERAPVDGELLSEATSFDFAHITGEALPQELSRGQFVAAGAVNRGGEVQLRALRQASQSRVARIANLVREATAQKTKLRSLVDRISAIFVPIVILIALATLTIWALVIQDLQSGVAAALAVLVVACPCALGIAIPMSMAVATGIGSRRGIVIRDADALSELRRVKTVIFDKTGTLTKGELRVVGVHYPKPSAEQNILGLAGAVAAESRHPVAKAISSFCQSQIELTQLPESRQSNEIAGQGVRVDFGHETLELNKPSALEIQLVKDYLGTDTLPMISAFRISGDTRALFLVEDEVRAESAEAIEQLVSLGLAPVLLSGDTEARVAQLANQLDIKNWFAETSPEDKLQVLRKLQLDSSVVMVGDGLNDTAVIAAADVGIAMGSGSHAAQSAAAITVLDDSPLGIAFAIKLGRTTWANLTQNLGWAFGYNLTLIPLAAFGLLEPMFAGIAMALSSVSVVINAKRMEWGIGSN